jgi:F420-dependent oxidoreductase-like protein
MAVQFGVFVPQGWRQDVVELADPVAQYEAMTQVARTADGLPAYDSIWVYDHFHTVPRPELQTTFEAWTTTAALGRDTQRVHVGQMVTCMGYRNPALLAKMASTVDVLSHGRLYCGIGAGWYEHEWLAYGYGFPETRDRMRAFREGVTIMMKMWTEERPTYSGEYYSIAEPINEPKGARQPHPALWIGGSGEQVTLKLVAQYADACNIGGDAATIRHKLDVLRQHCDAVGRPYDAIVKSTSLEDVVLLKPGEDRAAAVERARSATGVSLAATSQQLMDQIGTLVEAGITYIIMGFPRVAYDQEPMYRFADEIASKFA